MQMCGIAAIWGSVEQDVVTTMMERMVHRGPDASGVFVHPNDRGALGHRRLSIIDPAGGRQPILNASKRTALVANGEVYNHRALKRQLASQYDFQTGSDSEAILHLFDQVQDACVSQLDGMFAFVVGDGEHVFAARDPIGIKPLYVGQRKGALCFASEQKALVGIAQAVQEFPPGTSFHSARGYRRFYEVPESVAGEGVACADGPR
jgi:asparagine synthase (glutamine-hydrolysing)